MDIKWIRAWYVKRMCHLLTAVVLTAGLMIAAGAFSAQEVHAELSGYGTMGNPYKINSYEDLKEFSDMVKGGSDIGWWELTSNIQCGDLADWEPIGSESSPFNGHFNGNSHVIRGLSNEKREGAAGSNNQGLFGYIAADGEVKYVGLEGGKIIGNSKVGSLVGYNYGTIENCYNTGTISGSGTIGGLAGINYGTIEYCYNTGAISGKAVIGGIAGENHKTITYCWNTGEVSGKTVVGGVAGGHDMKTISSCFNTGKVIAVEDETIGESGEYAGGIAGFTLREAAITDCYNTGAVSAKNDFGGVVGYNLGKIEYCYYDKAYSAVTSVCGRDESQAVINAKGLQTSEMTGKDAIVMVASEDGMAFKNPDCWLVTANGIDAASGEYYEFYPHLKGFAYDIDPVVKNWPAKPHVHMQGGKKTYFLPWERTDQLPDTAGSYYLTGDVSLDAAWNPPGTVSLCLNDHSIANISTSKGRVISIVAEDVGLNLFDCGDTTRYYFIDDNGKGHVVAPDDDNYANAGEGQRGTFEGGFITGGKPATDGGGISVYESGTSFTMNGGTIIGNNALGTGSPINSGRGGGVYVNNGGEFTMNGGNIIGNTAKYFGGGVFSKGKFTMNGGNITGNTAGGHGGGIYLGEELETFSLSGDPMIIGNKVGENGLAEDIHLEAGQTITITDELKRPEGATTPKIGIAMESAGVFTSGYSDKNPNKAPSEYFISNDDNFVVAYDKDKKEAKFISNTVTAPTIMAQPEDLELDYGYKTENKLTVGAITAEETTLSYQWYSCSDQGTDEKAIDASKEPTAATAEYTLPSGIGAGSHYYFCKVTATNAGGKTASSDSSVATLTVNKAKLTLRVYDQEYEYNGDPHGEGDPTYDDPAVIAKKIEAEGLQNGDQITSLELDGSEKNIGKYENKIEITAFLINDDAGAKNNYNIELVAGTLTINKIKVEITTIPTASAITYGQSLADSTLTGGQAKAKDAEVPGTFVWVFDNVKPAVSDSDKTEYKVRFKPSDGIIYQTQDTRIKLTVNKADITPSVSIKGWTYGSEANEPVVSGNTGKGTEVFWYKEKDAPDSTYKLGVPADAGQYTVKAEIGETASYKAGSATCDFTIAPADMKVTSRGFKGDFDGSAHSITVEAPEGASVVYSQDKGKTYSEDNPGYTDAGDHAVPFRVTMKNYNDHAGTEIVSISQAANSVTVSAEGWTYGEPAKTPVVKAKFGADKAVLSYSGSPSGSFQPKVPENAGTWYVKATVPGTDNYKVAESKPASFKIAKADIRPSVSIQGWTYGSEANRPVVSGNEGNSAETVWYKEKDAPDSAYKQDVPVDAGQYTVKVDIDETDNYNGGSATLDFTISPADMKVVSSGFSGDFDGGEHSIDVEAPDGASIYYSWDGGKTYTSQKPTYTDVGEHVVPFDVRLKNHNNYTGSESVIIRQAPNSVTVSVRGWTYGEQPQLPTVTAKFGADKAVLSYSDAPDGTYQQGGPDQAGTWYVKATVPETKDYAGAESSPAVLVIAKAKIQITADDKKSLRGKDMAELSYTVSGAYVEGDDLGVALSTDADQDKVGTYPITVSWNQNPNYEAVLIDGEYKVTGISDEERKAAVIAMDAGLKGTSSNGKVTATWGKAKDADKYVIYATYCGVNTKCKKIKTVSGEATKFDIRKLAGKKLNKKRSVKYYVIAYKTVDGESIRLAKSRTVHVVGSANENASNIKAIKVKKRKFTLKIGKTAKIKAKLVLYKKNKKPLGHAAEFRYATSNENIAKVTENGKIKAVRTGKCKIYVYAQNGCAKKIKVTVK